MDDRHDVWDRFGLDPRDPAHAGLRAGDRDREVIAAVLGTAYAEGRLDREEHDERLETLAGTRTLGELPDLVSDLVPRHTPAVVRGGPLARATPADLQRLAVEDYRGHRRSAVFAFLAASLVCWVIWLAAGADGFVWPGIVSAVTGLNVARTITGREESIRDGVRRLEKKQRRQLKKPETPMGDLD